MKRLTIMLTVVLTAAVVNCQSAGRPQGAPAGAGHAPLPVLPADARDLQFAPESEVRLSGRATVGSWRVTSRSVDGTLSPGFCARSIQSMVKRIELAARNDNDARAVELAARPDHDPAANMRVPVRSLRSGNSAMERDLQNALKADQFPHVEFELEEIGAVSWRASDGKAVIDVEVEGTLSLAGQARWIVMGVQIERLEGDRYSVVGSKVLRMTDFGVKPPSALFGAIRAHDRVEVVFDLVVEDTRRIEVVRGAKAQ